MRTLTKACILFFMSVLLILMLPFVTAGETWAWYDTPNISYPAYNVDCGTGGLAPGIDVWFCWLNYTNKVMDHSFMNFSSMDAYYNPGGDGLVGGGETLTLSAYQEPVITTTSEPSVLSVLFAYIRALFV